MRLWEDVDRLLSALPTRLHRQTKLLEYDLALRHSTTGRFHDIFLEADQFPILDLAGWLLADLSRTADPRRHGSANDQLERRLFTASVLLAMRRHAVASIRDGSSFVDGAHIALAQFCSERVVVELASVLASDWPYWARHTEITLEGHEQEIEAREWEAGADSPEEPEAYLVGGWSPPARVLAAAVATLTGHDELAPRLEAVVDELATAFGVTDAIASLHNDLQQQRLTYPIAVIARLGGIPLRPAPAPEPVLGAMVLTGALPKLLVENRERLRRCRSAAQELGLAALAAFISAAEAAADRRLLELTGGAAGITGPAEPTPLVAVSEPTVPVALEMAEGYLLADTSFRESWETHREGMLGAPRVASHFPAGLILEILAHHGHEVGAEIDQLLAFSEANGYRYYDHPWSDIDTDTIGVVLRLHAFSATPDTSRPALDRALACLADTVRATRRVPVWLPSCGEADPERPAVIALGEGCATVAAHLLLGLLEADRQQHAETIEIGAGDLLARLAQERLAANRNYPPSYALAVYLRLLDRLEGWADTDSARAALTATLERAAMNLPRSAQEAALLTIACLEAGRPELVDDGWAVIQLKRQRQDGSWSGEPFAPAPNRGARVSWYSSTALTTALCYDALRRGAALA